MVRAPISECHGLTGPIMEVSYGLSVRPRSGLSSRVEDPRPASTPTKTLPPPESWPQKDKAFPPGAPRTTMFNAGPVGEAFAVVGRSLQDLTEQFGGCYTEEFGGCCDSGPTDRHSEAGADLKKTPYSNAEERVQYLQELSKEAEARRGVLRVVQTPTGQFDFARTRSKSETHAQILEFSSNLSPRTVTFNGNHVDIFEATKAKFRKGAQGRRQSAADLFDTFSQKRRNSRWDESAADLKKIRDALRNEHQAPDLKSPQGKAHGASGMKLVDHAEDFEARRRVVASDENRDRAIERYHEHVEELSHSAQASRSDLMVSRTKHHLTQHFRRTNWVAEDD